MSIRPERAEDCAAIRDVIRAAFAGMPHADGDEPELVEALRAAEALSVSLIAMRDERLVGHGEPPRGPIGFHRAFSWAGLIHGRIAAIMVVLLAIPVIWLGRQFMVLEEADVEFASGDLILRRICAYPYGNPGRHATFSCTNRDQVRVARSSWLQEFPPPPVRSVVEWVRLESGETTLADGRAELIHTLHWALGRLG